MLNIEAVNHIGIRIQDKSVSLSFYEIPGFNFKLAKHNIPLTGSFSFGNMSAVFIRDPDRNVIELDAYRYLEQDAGEYKNHP